MSPSSIMDKAIDNKFLLVFQRVGIAVMTLLMPLFVSYLFGLGSSVASVEKRVTIMETRDSSTSAQRNDQLVDLKAQVAELSRVVSLNSERSSAQNTAVLQSIARLEALVSGK